MEQEPKSELQNMQKMPQIETIRFVTTTPFPKSISLDESDYDYENDKLPHPPFEFIDGQLMLGLGLYSCQGDNILPGKLSMNTVLYNIVEVEFDKSEIVTTVAYNNFYDVYGRKEHKTVYYKVISIKSIRSAWDDLPALRNTMKNIVKTLNSEDAIKRQYKTFYVHNKTFYVHDIAKLCNVPMYKRNKEVCMFFMKHNGALDNIRSLPKKFRDETDEFLCEAVRNDYDMDFSVVYKDPFFQDRLTPNLIVELLKKGPSMIKEDVPEKFMTPQLVDRYVKEEPRCIYYMQPQLQEKYITKENLDRLISGWTKDKWYYGWVPGLLYYVQPFRKFLTQEIMNEITSTESISQLSNYAFPEFITKEIVRKCICNDDCASCELSEGVKKYVKIKRVFRRGRLEDIIVMKDEPVFEKEILHKNYGIKNTCNTQ